MLKPRHPKMLGKTLTEQRNAAVGVIESLEAENKQLAAEKAKAETERDDAKAMASRFAKRLNQANATAPAPATPAKSSAAITAKPAATAPATTKPQRKFSSHGELLASMPEGSLTGLDRAMAAASKRGPVTV